MPELILQRCVLGCGILFSVWGIVRIDIWPPATPLPAALSPVDLQELRLKGWKVSSKIPAQRRLEISNADGLVLTNLADEQLQQIQLSLVPVRARTHKNLDLKTISKLVLGKSFQNFSLKQIKKNTVMVTEDGSSGWLASTCIVDRHVSASRDVLVASLSKAPASMPERLNALLGLSPPRNWSCLFATIRVTQRQDFNYKVNATLQSIRPVFFD